MSEIQGPIEGTLSPKHQITIPAAIREVLGLRPGDKIEFRLQTGNVLELRVKRPKPSETVAAILARFDVSALANETNNDATVTIRESRWDEDSLSNQGCEA